MPTWKDQLDRLLNLTTESDREAPPSRGDLERFLDETVQPALEDFAEALTARDRTGRVERVQDAVVLRVFREDDEEFRYAVRIRGYRKPMFAFPNLRVKDDEPPAYRAEVYVDGRSQDYGIGHYDYERVIRNVLHEYEKALRWRRPTQRAS